jgi:Ca2+/Na+ antiporter
MSENGDSRAPIPVGFRSGVITAITVLLGFSFLFLRSWAFELPGEWNISSAIAAVLLLLAIVLELVALWRSLQLKDDQVAEYRRTLRWFLASIIVLLSSLVIAVLSYSEVLRF